MQRLLIIFFFTPFLIGEGLPAWGQYNPGIRSIRPGSAVGTYTIGKRVIQLQSGLHFRNKEGRGLDQNSIFFKNVIRFGITERTEISAVINWRKNKPDDPVIDGADQQGISNLRLGGRVNLINKKEGLLRGLGLNGRIWLKVPQEGFQTENPGGRIVLAAGLALPYKIRGGLNTGLLWRGNNQATESLYAFRLLRPLGKKVGVVAEMFGITDRWEPDYGTGIYLFLSNDFKIDLYMAFLGEKEIEDTYLEVGVSWRMKY